MFRSSFSGSPTERSRLEFRLVIARNLIIPTLWFVLGYKRTFIRGRALDALSVVLEVARVVLGNLETLNEFVSLSCRALPVSDALHCMLYS